MRSLKEVEDDSKPTYKAVPAHRGAASGSSGSNTNSRLKIG